MQHRIMIWTAILLLQLSGIAHSALPREGCPLRPKLPRGEATSWGDVLAKHSKGFGRVLIMCAPKAAVKLRIGSRVQGGELDVDVVRSVQGVSAVRTASKHAHLVGACILLLTAERCQDITPKFIPAATEVKAFPTILIFSLGGGQWHPHQRSRTDSRRMNGCGLQAECLLLDLADLARKDGNAAAAKWSSLETFWPESPKMSSTEGLDALHRPPDARDETFDRWHAVNLERRAAILAARGLRRSSAMVGEVAVAQCLVSFIDEVVRFQPVDNDSHRSRLSPSSFASKGFLGLTPSETPVLVLHYTALQQRKPRMRKRLRAANLTAQALFVEMEPDYLNDTMRRCLGPVRRQSIDSMADNPNWRYPTRGEDSLALKHLAAAMWLILSGRSHALILEDDVWFAQHLASDLSVLLRELSAVDWDVAAIGTCYHHRVPFGRRILPHAWLTQIMPCAHGYLLSQKGARAILQKLPLEMPIDLHINTIAQDGTPYDSLRGGRLRPGEASAEIYWASPQLAFQWPEDVTRSVERE